MVKTPTIEFIPIKNLVLMESNPRTLTAEALDKLCKSLTDDPDFLLNRPILINKIDGVLKVYAGTQRVRAAKKLKWKDVPCIVEENLKEEKIQERMLRDNLHVGQWDYDVLANEFDLSMLLDVGFDPEDLDLDLPANLEDNEEDSAGGLEPGKDEDAITKLGDVYELNAHRLVCGDSTMASYVQLCLMGDKPILMVTDPPYGVNYDSSWRKDIKRKLGIGARALGIVQNDDQFDWTKAWNLFPGQVAYVWCAALKSLEVADSLINCDFKLIAQIIWKKQHFALSQGDYHWQHEPCWYVVKNGSKHNWQGSRKESTIWEISNLNCFGKSNAEGEERTAHSTQKPIQCMSNPIKNNSEKGEGVYDPFLGSGTTLISAEQLNRICFGIELSPAYCDIIVKRWQDFMIKKEKEFVIKRNGEVFNG